MQFVLFNPLANNKTGERAAREYIEKLNLGEVEYKDVTSISVGEFMKSLGEDDRVILAGGDGTLNKFINALSEDPKCPVDYIPTGSGNDFKTDVGMDGEFIRLNDYIKDLPEVIIDGKATKFINNVGYGLDGYCCEVADELKKKSDKPINYAGIAIKGMMFHFKPRTATVTIDGGEPMTFKKVWLAPTMNGRYYGGGMCVTPEQDRNDESGKVSVGVWRGTGKLVTLMRFPKIFKGQHVKYSKMFTAYKGNEITVKFDKPTAVQIDGETVLGVTEYTVRTVRS